MVRGALGAYITHRMVLHRRTKLALRRSRRACGCWRTMCYIHLVCHAVFPLVLAVRCDKRALAENSRIEQVFILSRVVARVASGSCTSARCGVDPRGLAASMADDIGAESLQRMSAWCVR